MENNLKIGPFSRLTVGLVLGAAVHLAQADLVIKDDTGQEVRLKGPAKRIITLAPHAAESLFAAGAGDKLVGTVDYSDYPPEAKNCPGSAAIRASTWKPWPP
jgi:iron complex transport system substrate-binding protein